MKLPKGSSESLSVEVRPIDNGYIKRESRYSDTGDYSSKETYSQDKPVMTTETPKNNMMADAIKSIRK